MYYKGLIILAILLSFNCYSLEKNDPLKIGTLYFNPPFEEVIENSRSAFGFNIDIIRSICAVMQKNCELVPMRFDKLLIALDNHQIDAMIVGISLMPEHPEHYLFSYPYFISQAIFLTLRSNQLETLDNKTVGMVKNTLFPLADHYELFFVKRSPVHVKNEAEINFKFYNNLPELLSALDNHEVDAIVLDAGAASYWINEADGKYMQIGPVIQRKKGMAIMTTKGNSLLIQQINQALLTIEDNQTLLAIYKKYWGALTADTSVSGYLVKKSAEQYHFVIQSAFPN